MKSILINLAAIYFFFFLFSHIQVEAATWGEKCVVDPADDCDKLKFLECDAADTFKCICQNKDKSYFDMFSLKCHISIREECQVGPNSQPCPLNGWCDLNLVPPVCGCMAPAVPTPTNKCAMTHGEDCVDDSNCDGDSFIKCLGTKKCGCDDTISVYDDIKKACVLKLHQSCMQEDPSVSAIQECGSGADCKLVDGQVDQFECQCQEGLSDNGNGACRLGYAQTCGGELTCDETKYLTCTAGGQCNCEGNDLWYHKKDDICKLRYGLKCTNTTDPAKLQCYPNSFCDAPPNQEGFCNCEGYTHPNHEGLCFLEGGQICTPGDRDQCDVVEFQHCDDLTLICGCIPKPEVIQESTSTCRIRANAECTQGIEAQPCTSHSQCVNSKCECNVDLVESKMSGKCVRAYDQACGAELDGGCDTDAFQSCSAQYVCACMDEATMRYDGSSTKCKLKAGSECKEQSIIDCTDHSTCLSGSCTCDTGFVDNNGACDPVPKILEI